MNFPTDVEGGRKTSPPSTRSRASNGITPQLTDVIEKYESMVEPELFLRQIFSKPVTWRQMRPNNRPQALHYQFLDNEDSIDVDIHIEHKDLKPLAETLRGFIPLLRKQFTNLSIAFDSSWCKCGRLRIIVPRETDSLSTAKVMVRPIELTKDPLSTALEQLPPAPPPHG